MPNRTDTLKSWFWVIINIAIAAVVVLTLVATKALLRYSRSVSPAQTITVTAEGKTAVIPDLATLYFAIVDEGTDPVKLQTDNNAKMNDVIAYLKSENIEAKDIKTTGYNLNPKYTYNPKTGESFIDGYTLRQSAEVKVRDFAKIGTLLGALPSRGVNDVSGPNFSVEDPDKYLNQARQEAFEKAKEKARTIVEFAGARLGRVVTFSESSGQPPIIFFDRMAKEAGGFGGAPVPAPAVEPGSQEVTLSISVTYEIW